MRALLLSLLMLGSAAAEPFEYRVALTRQDASMDWWYAVPEPFAPQVSTISSVARGEYFSIIPIFKKYGIDSNSTARITYDLEIIRPDGSIAESVKDCMAHNGAANPSTRIPSEAVVQLCFEPDDPYGEYKICVTAYDHILSATNRQNSVVELQAFQLKPMPRKERDALFLEYAVRPDPSRAFSSFLYTEESFFNEDKEPVWSAIWFFKTVFGNNDYLLPHLLHTFPMANEKQQADIILLLALLGKSDELPKIPPELTIFRRVMVAGRTPDPYGAITSGKQLDMLWAEHFATGKVKPIRQIILALELIEHVGTLERIKAGELDPAEPEIYRDGMLEGVFQSALWSLRTYCTESPLVFHYCIGILESEELAKPVQSCLAMLLKSVADSHETPKQEGAP